MDQEQQAPIQNDQQAKQSGAECSQSELDLPLPKPEASAPGVFAARRL
jgi:hypothetical protein